MSPSENIWEKRMAFLELTTILKQTKGQYGNNPPIEILAQIAELANDYKKKYVGSKNKAKEDDEFQNFCVKNGLSLV